MIWFHVWMMMGVGEELELYCQETQSILIHQRLDKYTEKTKKQTHKIGSKWKQQPTLASSVAPHILRPPFIWQNYR